MKHLLGKPMLLLLVLLFACHFSNGQKAHMDPQLNLILKQSNLEKSNLTKKLGKSITLTDSDFKKFKTASKPTFKKFGVDIEKNYCHPTLFEFQ